MKTLADVARQRLRNEHLVGPPLARPEDVVAWLGAVQSQDYPGAKWAVGLRTRKCGDADVEAAYDTGRILRTHVMRPTWHFVTPADLRWMLTLTAPRVHALSAYQYRQHELDAKTLRRSHDAMARALEGGHHLVRTELVAVLERARIAAAGPRLGHLLMAAELDQVIVSGPRRGKHATYALLDERVPATSPLAREEALATLAGRYFASHGPALPQDFAWWSGLSVADAKVGIELARPRLEHEDVEGKTYWFAPPLTPPRIKDPTIHLLPNYDEVLISYKDYRPAIDSRLVGRLGGHAMALANHIIVLNGRLIGGWRRLAGKAEVIVETRLLTPVDAAQREALQSAAQRLGKFLDLPCRVVAAAR